MILIKDIV